jgi:hypothetical protein
MPRTTPKASSWQFFTGIGVGAIFISYCIGCTIITTASYVRGHWDELVDLVSIGQKKAETPAKLPSSASAPPNQTAFLNLYWNDGRPPQVFELTYTGTDEIAGSVVDQHAKTTGAIRGYRRAGALVLQYGSLPPDRPGFGVAVLKEKMAPMATDPKVAFGVALVHDCLCPDGTIKPSFGKVFKVAAVLADRPDPPADIDRVFRKIAPQEVKEVWDAAPQAMK